MCLVIKKNSKVKTAKEDIICYKFVESKTYSPDIHFTPFKYRPIEIGCSYESELKVEIDLDANKSVEIGLHSFKTITDCIRYALPYVDNNDNETIVKCIIPKGSQYYEGKFISARCYASTAITYVEVIERYVYNNQTKKTEICV